MLERMPLKVRAVVLTATVVSCAGTANRSEPVGSPTVHARTIDGLDRTQSGAPAGTHGTPTGALSELPDFRRRFFVLSSDQTRCLAVQHENRSTGGSSADITSLEMPRHYLETLDLGVITPVRTPLEIIMRGRYDVVAHRRLTNQDCSMLLRLRAADDTVARFEVQPSRSDSCVANLPRLDQWFFSCEACERSRANARDVVDVCPEPEPRASVSR